MQHVENELDITLEKLTQTTTKLDEKLKAYALAEGEIQALKRKISLLEDELERWVVKLPSHTSPGPSLRELSLPRSSRRLRPSRTRSTRP
jgi:hypothetical protein